MIGVPNNTAEIIIQFMSGVKLFMGPQFTRLGPVVDFLWYITISFQYIKVAPMCFTLFSLPCLYHARHSRIMDGYWPKKHSQNYILFILSIYFFLHSLSPTWIFKELLELNYTYHYQITHFEFWRLKSYYYLVEI